MLFLGRYEYVMDDRGRIPLPPRFREELSRGVILTFGRPDQCVRGYSSAGFDDQASLYLREPAVGRQGRVMRRVVFGLSYAVELDRQGRVVIPPPLRRWAELDGQVVVAGTGEGFEVWRAERFEAAVIAEAEEFGQALESLRDRLAPGHE